MRLKSVRSDPNVWITQLEHLQVKTNNTKETSITDDDLMDHILGNLPSVYAIDIHGLQKRINNIQDPLTLEELSV